MCNVPSSATCKLKMSFSQVQAHFQWCQFMLFLFLPIANSSICGRVLQKFHTELRRNLNIPVLLPYLIKYHLITANSQEELSLPCNNNSHSQSGQVGVWTTKEGWKLSGAFHHVSPRFYEWGTISLKHCWYLWRRTEASKYCWLVVILKKATL